MGVKKGASSCCVPVGNDVGYITSGQKSQLVGKKLLMAQHIGSNKADMALLGKGAARTNLFKSSVGEVPGSSWDMDNG